MISVAHFVEALGKLPAPTSAQIKFLQAHIDAPGRALTATKLARAAGYDGYEGINLQYGLLAARIEEQLGLERIGLSRLVDLVQPADLTNEHWILIMNNDFAEALRSSGWVV